MTPTRTDLLAGLRLLSAMRSQAVARGKRSHLPWIAALERAAVAALREPEPAPVARAPRLLELWGRPAFAPTTAEPMDTQFAGRPVRGDTLLATVPGGMPR